MLGDLNSMHYSGPERRRRRVFVTRNTEYHVFDRLCVAVKNRNTDEWYTNHEALGKEVVALTNREGYWTVDLRAPITPGWRLCFANDLITSPLSTVRRPRPETVDVYPQFGYYAA